VTPATRERYQRARRPGEKEARREAILSAAARLIEGSDPQSVTLNAIAAEAGLSKPNLYRYFQSREEIMLHLFLDDLRSFAAEVAGKLETVPVDIDSDRLADIQVDAYASRPRLCRFLGLIASVLEQNASERVLREVKVSTLETARMLAAALHRATPELSVDQCLWLNSTVALFVAGLWPPAHPSAAVEALLGEHAFEALRPHFRRDLRATILTLLAGLRCSSDAAP
jgi:AcrR family transcriptional regulator